MLHHVVSSFDTYQKYSIPHMNWSLFVDNISSLIFSNLSSVEMIEVVIILNLETYLIEKDCVLVNNCILYLSINKIATIILLRSSNNWLWLQSFIQMSTIWRGATLLVHHCWLGFDRHIIGSNCSER